MRQLKLIILSILALAVSSCHETIHEHPDEGAAAISLRIDVKKSGPELYKVIEYDGTSRTIYSAQDYKFPNSRADLESTLQDYLAKSSVNLDEWDLRITWELHSGSRDDIRNGDSQLIQRECVIADYSPDVPGHTIYFNAPAGEYTLLAWADFVPKGTIDDYYYDTQNMNALMSDLELRRNCENNDQRDCFANAYEFVVAPVSYEGEAQSFVTTLIRPQGRYVILANDYERYLQLSSTPPEDNIVEVSYPTFVNVSYSVLEEHPNDGATGLGYYFSPRTYDFDDERMICVADDYSFVNGDISYVHVNMTVFTPNNAQLSKNKNIEIPLYADKLTVVIGKFLATSSGSGGISIDDGFDGEFVVPYLYDTPKAIK